MIIDKIKIGKSIEVIGLWHRLDLEATIDEHESPEWAHGVLKDLLDKLLPSVNGSPLFHPPTTEINKEKERTEIAIDNSSSKEELKLLMNDAMKYDLVKQYLAKQKTLE